MSKERELEVIRTMEQEAFRRKQSDWNAYVEAQSLATKAYNAMQSAWKQRCAAKECMNHEHESLQQLREYYCEVWTEYYNNYSCNILRISILKQESNHEYQEMVDCLERANHEHKYGIEASASAQYQEGCKHKKLYEDLNSEISSLISNNLYIKEDAARRAPKPDTSDFDEARKEFKCAKSNYEMARDEFENLKAECTHKKDAAERSKKEYDRIREELQEKLQEYGVQESDDNDIL